MRGGEGKLRERGRREKKRGREERPRLALWVEPVFGKWLCHDTRSGQVRSGQDGTIQVQLISLPLVSVPLPGRVTHSFLAHFPLPAVSNPSHIHISIVAQGKEGQ
jgi:hypothetical protein